jgi:predicted dehydrogenase
MRKMRLFQQNAYLAVDFLKQKTEILHLSQHPVPPDQSARCIGDIGVGDQAKSIFLHTPEPATCNALEQELKSFAHSITHTTRPVVNGQDGLRALHTAEVILQEMRIRQELAAKKAGL